MFRKLILALSAVAAIGAASMTPAAASPHGWHGHGHHGHGYGHFWRGGFGYGFYPAYVGGDCYVIRKVVRTPYGPVVRRVSVCD